MSLNKKQTKGNSKSNDSTFQNNISGQIPSFHRFTKNTLSEFERLIKKFALVQKSKSLASNDLSIIQSIFRGRIVCRKAGCFHLTVSEGLVNRSIQFLNVLALELESRKFKIQYVQDNLLSYVVAIKDNEQLSFHISEGYSYQIIKNEDRSELESMLFRDRKPIPSGKLTLYVKALNSNISKYWVDDAKEIEKKFTNIINGFDKLVLSQKQHVIDEVLKENERAEAAKVFNENQSRKYAEKAVYDSAMKESQAFKELRDLEAYLKHLEVNCLEEYGYLNEATLSWLSTARKLAEAQNPTRKRIKLLGEQYK